MEAVDPEDARMRVDDAPERTCPRRVEVIADALAYVPNKVSLAGKELRAAHRPERLRCGDPARELDPLDDRDEVLVPRQEPSYD